MNLPVSGAAVKVKRLNTKALFFIHFAEQIFETCSNVEVWEV